MSANLLFSPPKYMGVSKNRGTPKSSILIGFSIINHPFWGFSTYFWKHPYTYTGSISAIQSGFSKPESLGSPNHTAWGKPPIKPRCEHRGISWEGEGGWKSWSTSTIGFPLRGRLSSHDWIWLVGKFVGKFLVGGFSPTHLENMRKSKIRSWNPKDRQLPKCLLKPPTWMSRTGSERING